MKDRLIWLDCETTGLNCNKDLLLQVAVVVTDADLVPVAPGLEVTIWHPRAPILILADEYVTDMHRSSGLITACDESLYDTRLAEQMLLRYLEEHTEPNASPMCGSSIGFDRGFIKSDMPTLHEHFHYRNIDVSTVKELVRRWHPEAYSRVPTKKLSHTALSDVMESIAELAYYKQCSII